MVRSCNVVISTLFFSEWLAALRNKRIRIRGNLALTVLFVDIRRRFWMKYERCNLVAPPVVISLS